MNKSCNVAKVSILMAVYNETESVLRQSIESILHQTFKDFEFVIIGDNPNNKALISIVNEYAEKDERIKFHINKENIGLTKSLNVGLRLCTGMKYIARMDADDIAFPNRLEKQVDFLEKNQSVDILNTAIIKFRNDDLATGYLMTVPSDSEKIIGRLLYFNPLFHPTIMIRKSFIDKNKIKYNEAFRRSQDYALWLELASHGAVFASLQEPLLYYRASANQISIKHRDEQKQDAEAIFIYYLKRTIQDLVHPQNRDSVEKMVSNLAKAVYHDGGVSPYHKEILYRILLSYDKWSSLVSLISKKEIRRIQYSSKRICVLILSCFINRWNTQKIDLYKLL